MSLKYLNLTGLSRVVTNLKNWVVSQIPTKTSEITNDSGFITSSSLPTVNNATLTIQKNGTNVQTFTANASSNKTANITVPTKTSELTNDSGFLSNTLTNNTSKGALGWSSSIGTNIPTLNTIAYWNGAYANTSSNLAYCVKGAFGDIVTHNASEFLTSHQSLSNYSTLANTVKSLSISGKTITVTPGSGSTYTLTTQDTVYTHPTSAGNKHIPSGGSANQYLKYSASGTAVWADLPTIPTKTSQLTNDSGFLTSHQSLAGYLPLAGGTMTGNLGAPTIIVSGIYAKKHPDITKGTNPSGTKYWTITFADKNGTNYSNNCLGMLETSITSAGVVATYIRAMKNTAANSTCAQISAVYDTANSTGYATCPTPAADSNDTKIATTAWVVAKGYLTSHQSLSNYVTLNGTQTITAEKTFKSDIVFNGTYNLRSNSDNSYVRIQGGSGEGKGSRIILSGKTRSGLQGYAEIVATDGTNTNTFTVKPNGETLVNGNNLAATIIKGLSVNGKTITYTKIDGSTGTITTQDTVYTHPTSAGNKHIPSGGSSGQILKYSSSGTAVWADPNFAREMSQIATRSTVDNGTWTISIESNRLMMIVVHVTGSASSTTHKVSVTLYSGAHALIPNTASLVALSSTASNIANSYYCLLWTTSTSVKITIGSVTALNSLSLTAYQ